MTKNVEYINPGEAGPPQGLYSHVCRVEAGDLLFIAGQLAVGKTGELVGRRDFDAQFHQVFENLGTVLKGMGGGFDDVVKFTTYMIHSQDIPRFMDCRSKLFPNLFSSADYPPNTLLITDRLVSEDFLVEVEAIARAR